MSGFEEFFSVVDVGCMFLLVFDWLAVMFFSEELGVTLGFFLDFVCACVLLAI